MTINIPLNKEQRQLAVRLGIEGATDDNPAWLKPTEETLKKKLGWTSDCRIEVVGYFVSWLHKELYVSCYVHKKTSWGGRNTGADISQSYPVDLFEPAEKPEFNESGGLGLNDHGIAMNALHTMINDLAEAGSAVSGHLASQRSDPLLRLNRWWRG